MPAPLFRIIFLPLQPFIGHPERAMWMAVVFLILPVVLGLLRGFKPRRKLPILLASLCWAGFSLWEAQAVSEKWNIRVELLLIGPVLLVVSTVAIVLAVHEFKAIGSDDRGEPPAHLPDSTDSIA